jgi:hypothetical protein
MCEGHYRQNYYCFWPRAIRIFAFFRTGTPPSQTLDPHFTGLLLEHGSSIFVVAERNKLRMPQPVPFGPLQEFDNRDQFGTDPDTLLQLLGVQISPQILWSSGPLQGFAK